ncbi:hypothetical protein [Azospirillum sp. TSO5]|uniref:hypothetical protein n=1 Tax=Azospirillum sp. TSO5 TaxID=716760 RepID=UPI000D616EC6|nr:hypothetical protein [Azospirillum sp. TSO5]PWC98069.1 hypothetical protein TSO5_03455 [Azospirillum sp. TSO5]
MKISNTDQPSPDTPERNKLIAYLREKHPNGEAHISTSSRGPGVTEEEAAAEILRVLKGMDDGTVASTAHEAFDDEPLGVRHCGVSDAEERVLSGEGGNV